MRNPKSPCKDCPNRHENCWSASGEYKEYKNASNTYKETVRSIKKQESDWFSVAFSRVL